MSPFKSFMKGAAVGLVCWLIAVGITKLLSQSAPGNLGQVNADPIAGVSSSGTSGTPIPGVTNGSNAAAGYVGEFVQSLVASGSAVSLTTATAANVTSIPLSAGDWDVMGNVSIIATTATQTASTGGINTTSATVPSDGSQVNSGVQLSAASTTDGLTMPRKRVNVSTTTTVYLVVQQTFSAGTEAAYGQISARRVR